MIHFDRRIRHLAKLRMRHELFDDVGRRLDAFAGAAAAAPSAAPTQGQHAAPPAAVIPPAPKDTAPAAARPVPTQARHYSVQVAAVHRRAEADSISASLVADGFPPQIDTEQGWLKVRVGDFATAREARAMLARIKAARGGAPFIVRR